MSYTTNFPRPTLRIFRTVDQRLQALGDAVLPGFGDLVVAAVVRADAAVGEVDLGFAVVVLGDVEEDEKAVDSTCVCANPTHCAG